MLWPSYKWRLRCHGTHTLEIMPFLVCRSNLRGMKLGGFIIFAGGSPEDFGSALLDPCLWELCFSLVSPLFPSFVLGNVSGEGGTLLVPLSLFSILLSLPLFFFSFSFFSFSLPSFLLFFHISFSLFPFLTHKLFPSLSSSSPLFHLFPFLLSLFFF